MSDDSHKHDHSAHIQKSLNIAFWINLLFALLEIVGGIFANSSAILASAVHDLCDSLAIYIGIQLEKKSHQKPDNTFTFGYKRLSVLSSLISGAILISGSLLVLKEGVFRFFQPQIIDSQIMFGLAIIGVFVNLFGVFKTIQKRNQNEKIINLHLVEDTFGWASVLIGSVIIYLTHWYWLDGLLGVGIALYTIKHAIDIVRENMFVFLNGTDQDVSEIKSKLLEINGVVDIHDMHIWTNSNQHDDNLSVHVQVRDYEQQDQVKSEIDKLMESFHIHHTTVQFEKEKCAVDCSSTTS